MLVTRILPQTTLLYSLLVLRIICYFYLMEILYFLHKLTPVAW